MILKKYFSVLLLMLLSVAGTGYKPLMAVDKSLAERFAEEARERVERHINWEREQKRRFDENFAQLQARGADSSSHPEHARYLEYKRKQDRADKREDQWEQLAIDANKAIVGVATDFYKGEIEKSKIEAEKKTKIGQAYASSLAAQEGITERSNNMWAKLTSGKNIAIWSTALIAIPVAIYGCKLGLDYASSKWGMPQLVKESSRKSLKQTIMGWFSSKKEKKVDLNDVVLAPELDKEVKAIAERTKKKQKYGAPYQNLLLYGPPGTGKTEFARMLARYSDMDYAIIDGGSFGQFKKGSRGVTEINKLFDWAEHSSRGLLIFIDEADAFAPDRKTITDADELNIINTFIARTGAPSTKYMIVFATNHRDALDSAVRSRLGKPVEFGLPELAERAKILRKKIEQHIEKFELKAENNKPAIKLTCDKEAISDEFMTKIATPMKCMSGRDIEKAVIDMQAEAIETDNRMLTKDIVKTVADSWVNKVAEDRKITEAQDKKHAIAG